MSQGETPKSSAIRRIATMLIAFVPFSYFCTCCHTTPNSLAISWRLIPILSLNNLRRRPMAELSSLSTTRPMTYSYSFWLPFPPSANRLWRYGARGKVYLSAQYTKWKRQADSAVQIQKFISSAPVLGKYEIKVQLSDAFLRRGDADNRLKAINDWCQRTHLVVNDRHCAKASIMWSDNIEHDCLVELSGLVAFRDRWEFARLLANPVTRNSARRG